MLVFVQGESWAWGSSALYDARILATLGRIIVVTFNYRLGVFGESSHCYRSSAVIVISTLLCWLILNMATKHHQEDCKQCLNSGAEAESGDTDWSAAGFLNTNPSPMTKGSVSNYGLVDQMAALQWVGENVEQFGGDKTRITLMGQVGVVTSEIYAAPTQIKLLKLRVAAGYLRAAPSRSPSPCKSYC